LQNRLPEDTSDWQRAQRSMRQASLAHAKKAAGDVNSRKALVRQSNGAAPPISASRAANHRIRSRTAFAVQ